MGVPATSGQPRTSLAEMQIGDYIPCRYKAASGEPGMFSELGTCTAAEIPVTSSAEPDGLFYFIKADKGLLIADRVVQTNISWDILNSNGLIEGSRNRFTLIPMMTSYTCSVGKAFASREYADAPSYFAFSERGWSTGGSYRGEHIGFIFNEPTVVKIITYIAGGAISYPAAVVVEGTDNEASWVVIKSFSGLGYYGGTLDLNNSIAYKGYRVRFTQYNGAGWSGIGKVRFIGDNKFCIRSLSSGCTYADFTYTGCVPIMTSNTTPRGVAFADSEYDINYSAKNVFDENSTTFWNSSATTLPHYIGYEFAKDTTVSGYLVEARTFNTDDLAIAPKDWQFQASIDGVNWITLDTKEDVTWQKSGQKKLYKIDNINAYTMYRLFITANNGYSAGSVGLATLAMYDNTEIDLIENRFVLSTTDKGLGAWPSNNEWDKYIVNSDLNGKIIAGDDNVWHWNHSICSICSDTPINGLDGASTLYTSRINRGYKSLSGLYKPLSNLADVQRGFRPVIEYMEPDGSSKQATIWY